MATYFYLIRITKVSVGTAVEHRIPALQGTIQRAVTHSESHGDYQLLVVEADDRQHEVNVALPDVQEMSAKDAQERAPQFQPKRVMIRFDPLTRKETVEEMPAADLTPFISNAPSRTRNHDDD